ncbi:MAG: FAD:protein FMN transferase [Fimbriimonadaceae bacterium]|nr:FAD:protein FMN transferase [Fimbriimonadaceae bacterium]
MLFAAMALAVAPQRFQFTQSHMGVAVRLTLYAPDRATAERAGRAGFARFAELDAMMSDYQPGSELNRWVARAGEGPVAVSPELFEVLLAAKRVSALSEGAFDVTAGPVVRLWRESRRSGSLPETSALEEARSRVGWRQIRLDSTTRTAEISQPGIQVDLGGIAKGFACDQAILAMAAQGVGRAMVEAGGDIAVSGPPPGTKGWRITVRGLEREALVLAHQAVSTSGDAEQFVEIGGVRYSHIVDPRTGLGLRRRLQATVVARRGIVSDPLATALCVMGRGPGDRLAKRYGAEAIWVGPETE